MQSLWPRSAASNVRPEDKHVPVQHLGGGPLVSLQQLLKVGGIVAGGAPAQHAREVVPRAQR